MVKSKTNLFLIVILIITICSYFILNPYQESFYSNNDTTNAKSNIDDLLSNKMSNLMMALNDINSNKYSLDVTTSISNLGNDMPKISTNSNAFVKIKKNELSTIQKNLNKINDALLNFVSNTRVEQYMNLNDEGSLKSLVILDAINKSNDALKKISKELSEIPE